jgi:hypothetical protein
LPSNGGATVDRGHYDRKSGTALDRIKPIGFGQDDPIQVLIYGRSGTGKTSLWSTFPGPILAVICSGGLNPGELRTVDTAENRDKISSLELQHSNDLLEVMDHLRQQYDETGKCPYKTLVLDHASGLQDQVLAELLGMREVPVAKYKRAGKGESWNIASVQTYGQVSLMCKEMIRSMLGLPCNVVIVAQERNFDEGGNAELIAPSVGAGLTPSLAGWLNTAVDYIVNTFIRPRMEARQQKVGNTTKTQMVPVKGQVEFCLRTAPDPTYVTKFRMPRGAEMPNVVVDPDYDKIHSIIRGEWQG